MNSLCIPDSRQGNTRHVVQVTMLPRCTIATSKFSTGMTYSDASLDAGASGDATAIYNADALIAGSMDLQNTHIMGWGMPDPWPDPSTPGPTDWTALDGRMQSIVAMGGTPVITLDEAPWWMKGQLQADGSTKLLTADDEWNGTLPYSSRILDDKMSSWLQLVQAVAERYMVAPYNVRDFQVWNELKGYYDPAQNDWDMDTSAGDPAQPVARHGYTYMYNQVYKVLMRTATALGIPDGSIMVGGPYIFLDHWEKPSQESNPSKLVEPYGTIDQRDLDVVQYWLQHKIGAGFITLDSSTENRGTGRVIPDPFTASDIYADMVTWVRSLDNSKYPGAATLPIWFAEWYASPHMDNTSADYDDAVKAYAMIKFLEAGGSTALIWSTSGDNWADKGVWTSTQYVGGGQPEPWYYTLKAFKDDFAPGTKIVKSVVSAPTQLEVMASAQQVMLVNKTAQTLTVSINGKIESLNPYAVRIVNYASK